MRAAIYARYSSDNQREASIEDQARICGRLIEREGWELVGQYADHAVSRSKLPELFELLGLLDLAHGTLVPVARSTS